MRTEGDLIKINDLAATAQLDIRQHRKIPQLALRHRIEEEPRLLDSRHLGGQYHRGRFGKDPACGILDSPLARQGENCRAVTWIQTQEPRICTCR